jgi:hypothetical protein
MSDFISVIFIKNHARVQNLTRNIPGFIIIRFSMVKSISNLVRSFIFPAWAMMASTASINKFSVSNHLKSHGNFKSWAKGTNHFMRKFIDGRNIKSSIIMNNMLDDLRFGFDLDNRNAVSFAIPSILRF